MSGRKIVASAGAVSLAEPLETDHALLADIPEPFAVDPDDRRFPMPVWSTRLVVLSEGELAGDCNHLPMIHGPTYPCLAWMIGCSLLPSFRGRGIGTTTQRLLAEYLFGTTDIDRIEAETDAENVAEMRSLEKAGFVREGIVRGAQLRGGRRRDLVRYSVLRAELGEGP